jgi:hypothetical protein
MSGDEKPRKRDFSGLVLVVSTVAALTGGYLWGRSDEADKIQGMVDVGRPTLYHSQPDAGGVYVPPQQQENERECNVFVIENECPQDSFHPDRVRLSGNKYEI